VRKEKGRKKKGKKGTSPLPSLVFFLGSFARSKTEKRDPKRKEGHCRGKILSASGTEEKRGRGRNRIGRKGGGKRRRYRNLSHVPFRSLRHRFDVVLREEKKNFPKGGRERREKNGKSAEAPTP